jgi:hypothetical protein
MILGHLQETRLIIWEMKNDTTGRSLLAPSELMGTSYKNWGEHDQLENLVI